LLNTPLDIFEDLLTKVLANGEWKRLKTRTASFGSSPII
jgi:hypothetical protein